MKPSILTIVSYGLTLTFFLGCIPAMVFHLSVALSFSNQFSLSLLTVKKFHIYTLTTSFNNLYFVVYNWLVLTFDQNPNLFSLKYILHHIFYSFSLFLYIQISFLPLEYMFFSHMDGVK